MTSRSFNDFGELYRAAFAERDPERKLVLLTEVTRTIDQWKKGVESETPVPRREPGSRTLDGRKMQAA